MKRSNFYWAVPLWEIHDMTYLYFESVANFFSHRRREDSSGSSVSSEYMIWFNFRGPRYRKPNQNAAFLFFAVRPEPYRHLLGHHGRDCHHLIRPCSSGPWRHDGDALAVLDDWVNGLQHTERKVFSLNGEDGIIEAIFDRFGEGTKYFVEFGCQDGAQTSTRLLRERKGWTFLLMDGDYEDLSINLHREFVSASQICGTFSKYLVLRQIALLSVDIDLKTLDVLEQILRCGYSPRVIVVEYNAALGALTSARVPQNLPETAMWDGQSNYFGASMLAITKILREHVYSLLLADNAGVNLFFARNDQLGCADIALISFIRRKFVGPGFGLPADAGANFLGDTLKTE